MIAFLICTGAILVLQLLTPIWWWSMVVPFGYFLIMGESKNVSFFMGMSSAGIVWLFSSIYFYFNGSQIITSRIAEMMQLPHPILLILTTALIAALAGGFAGLSGFFVRSIFATKEK